MKKAVAVPMGQKTKIIKMSKAEVAAREKEQADYDSPPAIFRRDDMAAAARLDAPRLLRDLVEVLGSADPKLYDELHPDDLEALRAAARLES